jgi:GTPase SAR1 family protein
MSRVILNTTDTSYLKFVILGDHGVGKSAIAQRFAMDAFPTQYKETVGMDMYRNTVFLPGIHFIMRRMLAVL